MTRPDALDSPCYKETNYFCIKVIDVDPSVDPHNVRELVLDHLIHSYNSLTDPTYLKYGYIKVYADMIEYVAQKYPKYSAFFIGGGGYTLPRQMETLRPDAKIVVAEIDPGVTQTNFERLGVDPNTRIITHQRRRPRRSSSSTRGRRSSTSSSATPSTISRSRTT